MSGTAQTTTTSQVTDVLADLASHCRLLLYNRPKHKLLWRWFLLYPLYALSEIAIISTDLAELLGSAIALCMLFPKLPLWAGVLLTAADVLLLLAFRDPVRGRPVRVFELFIAILVRTVPSLQMLALSSSVLIRLRWSYAGIHSADLHGDHHIQGKRAMGGCLRWVPSVKHALQVRRTVHM